MCGARRVVGPPLPERSLATPDGGCQRDRSYQSPMKRDRAGGRTGRQLSVIGVMAPPGWPCNRVLTGLQMIISSCRDLLRAVRRVIAMSSSLLLQLTSTFFPPAYSLPWLAALFFPSRPSFCSLSSSSHCRWLNRRLNYVLLKLSLRQKSNLFFNLLKINLF